MTAAATIALAPLPADPLPPTHTAPVVLTGAWQVLAANVTEDLAKLAASINGYAALPILSQLSSNLTTYAYWLTGSHGGTPLKVVQTIGEHIATVGATIAGFSLLFPLSFVGPFIAPGVMILQLIADTAKYPSTPQTVLQAFIDAPAVFLNTALNCCSTPLFNLAFGLLNPGPLGYLIELPQAIARALQIPVPSGILPGVGTAQAAAASAAPVAAVRSPSTGRRPLAPDAAGHDRPEHRRLAQCQAARCGE